VAFRDTNGDVGIVDAFCPHRRAPMFFGRNEECGLRCVYHGWKFDRNGTCVDMPSEPPDSLFKTKVTINAYPTWEGGDIVWIYMGPLELQPPPPNYEWVRAPKTHRGVSKTFEDANYLQALEGGLDTAHSSFAHNEKLGDMNWVRNRDGAPRLDVERTDYGYTYVSTRNLGADGKYVRVYHYVMPAQQMRGGVTSWTGTGKADVPRLDGHMWVPIDDESTCVFNMIWSYDAHVPITPEWYAADEARWGRGLDDLVPGTFKLKKNLSNDFMIDRQMQKTKNFTGIVGLNTQDYALQEGMGKVVDRSKEHLGTTDKAIIACRQLLLEAVDAVAAGQPPRGVDPSTYERVRPYDAVVPPGKTWEAEFAGELVAKF
jgi:phthalate 4,5-dioxygenase oxygenase subunit